MDRVLDMFNCCAPIEGSDKVRSQLKSGRPGMASAADDIRARGRPRNGLPPNSPGYDYSQYSNVDRLMDTPDMSTSQTDLYSVSPSSYSNGHQQWSPAVPDSSNPTDAGATAGIGISWLHDVETGCFRVAAFTPNSSAQESGQVGIGDVLVDVDGFPAVRKSLREVAFRILGPRGSTVTLRLLPPNSRLIKTVQLVRREIIS
mmetsp:Transcript_77794/g.209664  ORF Transcript_77794/g.209664 Transcript_77794/m.209664 type:complete len:202 (+) Transcript_77794:54-659(+)|eukprot:CAMPEP_0113697580 /NCGR_PEP_ID=MMETSP0038_2-20120614/22214_1 /TAXON_ID=2898 /ORGANISM="Cryptomonas paramecium" /LENGTH=201 /DNA_ID=CAMNT_0000620609 /DNA_START=45 /DNA_END=650 /DNA_ORIENTATION=- /assembly_acc=CAM_ASM_000170